MLMTIFYNNGEKGAERREDISHDMIHSMPAVLKVVSVTL